MLIFVLKYIYFVTTDFCLRQKNKYLIHNIEKWNLLKLKKKLNIKWKIIGIHKIEINIKIYDAPVKN